MENIAPFVVLTILILSVEILVVLMIVKKATRTELLILIVPTITSIFTIYFITQDLLK